MWCIIIAIIPKKYIQIKHNLVNKVYILTKTDFSNEMSFSIPDSTYTDSLILCDKTGSYAQIFKNVLVVLDQNYLLFWYN